jgi:hypothetical protein
MEEFYDDPVDGRLTLKRSCTSQAGYVDVNKRVLARGVEYYAKTRLDLNKKKKIVWWEVGSRARSEKMRNGMRKREKRKLVLPRAVSRSPTCMRQGRTDGRAVCCGGVEGA